MPVHRAASHDRPDNNLHHHPFKILPTGEEKLPNVMTGSANRTKFEIDLMEEDRFIDIEADDVGMRFNAKRPHPDPTEMASQPSSTGTSRELPWNFRDRFSVDGRRESKKLKRSYVGSYDGSSPADDDRRCGEAYGDVALHDTIEAAAAAATVAAVPERYFFPVDSRPVMNFLQGDDDEFVSGKAFSPPYEPNLELALGAEKKPSPSPPPSTRQGILPWYLASFDKKTEQNNNNHKPPPDTMTMKEEEEDDDDAAAGSLSLSLSFSIPEKEQQRAASKPVPRTEQLLPERRPNVFLFGRGFPDS